jgi:hypothetical protein
MREVGETIGAVMLVAAAAVSLLALALVGPAGALAAVFGRTRGTCEVAQAARETRTHGTGPGDAPPSALWPSPLSAG